MAYKKPLSSAYPIMQSLPIPGDRRVPTPKPNVKNKLMQRKHTETVIFGRPFLKRFALLSVRCLSCLSVCDVGVLWPNGWMDQDETWHGGRPWPRPHCVRWGSSSPPQRGTLYFWLMSVVAKRLVGSRCRLVWR